MAVNLGLSPGQSTLNSLRNSIAPKPSVPSAPVSILGSFQTPSAQSNQASYSANLQGINQARAADTAGYNQASQFINQGATSGIAAINQGTQSGVAAINQGAQQATSRLEQGLTAAKAALSTLVGTTNSALEKFSVLSGLAGDPSGTLAAMQNDPSYQFRYNEGQRALQFGQAATGINGGRAAKELQAYGQGMASQELEAVQGRLLNLIGIGSPAIQQQAQYEQQTAGQIADIYSQAGTQSAGIYTQAGAQSAGIYGQQASSLASLRSQLAQNISTSYLAEGSARSQYELNRNPVITAVTQQGNRIGTRKITL